MPLSRNDPRCATAFGLSGSGDLALLLKHFVSLPASAQHVIWAKLSARVGGIEDKRKDDRYGYRASKAALNMLLQTAAIEIARRRPPAVVAALGPQVLVRQLLRALDKLSATIRVQLIDYRGQPIPW